MPLFHERSGAFSPEKTLFLCAGILPAAWLAGLAVSGGLGARPWSAVLHFSGLWAIRFLAASLAITPLRQLFLAPKLFFGRQIFGLAALGYALLHVGAFVIDQGLARAASEIVLRTYLLVGTVAVVLLVILGATSHHGVMRRLGTRRWQYLHSAVYLVAILATVHFFQQSRLDVSQPVLMTGVFVLLFLYRLTFRLEGAVTPARLVVLSLAAAVVTGALEVAWYGLATRVDPWRVAAANFSFALGPRPVWWIFAGGVAVALLAALRRRFYSRRGEGQRAARAPSR